MNIETTHNYKQFKFLKSNRVINASKVRKLTNEIIMNGQLVPIIINEKNEIIDGQHRVLGCEAANKPVTYIQISGMTVQDAANANTAGSNWSTLDWIHHYAAEGDKQYIDLLDFIERCKERHLNTTCAIYLAQNTATNKVGYRNPDGAIMWDRKEGFTRAGTNLTLGLWKFGDRQVANALLREIGAFADVWQFARKQNVVTALMQCRRIPGFSLKRLYDKATRYPDLWYDAGNKKRTLLMIETLYNFKVKQQHRLPIANNPKLANE